MSDAADPLGRRAARPSAFGWRAWRAVLGRVWTRMGTDHLSIVAAGVAFFGALAAFPSLAALLGLYGLVADPARVHAALEAARPLLPGEVHALIVEQARALIAARAQTLGPAVAVSLGFALWSARAGVMALVEGLNIVYRETDDRGFFTQQAVALGLTLLLILVAGLAMAAVVATPAALALADLGPAETAIARVAPLGVLGGALVFVIGLVYRLGPHRAPARTRWVSWGAVIAATVWAVSSIALSLYFSRFTDLNATYGALGAVAGLLLWLYVSAYVVLLGATLNAELEHQTARDTTTGPERPLGERGAFVADHVAPGPDAPEPAPPGR
jgi:membrane protein